MTEPYVIAADEIEKKALEHIKERIKTQSDLEKVELQIREKRQTISTEIQTAVHALVSEAGESLAFVEQSKDLSAKVTEQVKSASKDTTETLKKIDAFELAKTIYSVQQNLASTKDQVDAIFSVKADIRKLSSQVSDQGLLILVYTQLRKLSDLRKDMLKVTKDKRPNEHSKIQEYFSQVPSLVESYCTLLKCLTHQIFYLAEHREDDIKSLFSVIAHDDKYDDEHVLFKHISADGSIIRPKSLFYQTLEEMFRIRTRLVFTANPKLHHVIDTLLYLVEDMQHFSTYILPLISEKDQLPVITVERNVAANLLESMTEEPIDATPGTLRKFTRLMGAERSTMLLSSPMGKMTQQAKLNQTAKEERDEMIGMNFLRTFVDLFNQQIEDTFDSVVDRIVGPESDDPSNSVPSEVIIKLVQFPNMYRHKMLEYGCPPDLLTSRKLSDKAAPLTDDYIVNVTRDCDERLERIKEDAIQMNENIVETDAPINIQIMLNDTLQEASQYGGALLAERILPIHRSIIENYKSSLQSRFDAASSQRFDMTDLDKPPRENKSIFEFTSPVFLLVCINNATAFSQLIMESQIDFNTIADAAARESRQVGQDYRTLGRNEELDRRAQTSKTQMAVDNAVKRLKDYTSDIDRVRIEFVELSESLSKKLGTYIANYPEFNIPADSQQDWRFHLLAQKMSEYKRLLAYFGSYMPPKLLTIVEQQAQTIIIEQCLSTFLFSDFPINDDTLNQLAENRDRLDRVIIDKRTPCASYSKFQIVDSFLLAITPEKIPKTKVESTYREMAKTWPDFDKKAVDSFLKRFELNKENKAEIRECIEKVLQFIEKSKPAPAKTPVAQAPSKEIKKKEKKVKKEESLFPSGSLNLFLKK
ncbi:hypothetical protein BLNAU_13313 [Blattamonas nauphoetae]|uniref:Exocyst complex component Sec6 n=1 Tax=Blattamonas nauphoetae TaxID=2049346 RepID=A0ABQ9XN72_9EUKA|nr:hypothetical protein BLNAU_13313 [Blattamonas nauphoetae]